MGGYLGNGGLKTWYDEQGVGEPLGRFTEGCRRTRPGRRRCRTSRRSSE